MRKSIISIETMRKSLLAFAAILCCATAATVFTACSSDDNNENSSDTKSAKVELQLSFSESADIMKYCDVCIEYDNGTGAKTDTLTATTWTKTLTAKLPASFSVKKTVTLKAGVDLSTDTTTFNCTEAYSYRYDIINADGGITATDGHSEKIECDGEARQMAEGIKNGDFNESLTLVFDANGKLTKK